MVDGNHIINVIGGSGFIGRNLTYQLEKSGISFCVIDKLESPLFPEHSKIADVRSIEALRQTVTENAVLINLAAEHGDDVFPRSLYDDVNVEGAANICKIAREKNIKTIIFTSSVAVYGEFPNGGDENGPAKPHTDYGRTKLAAEQEL